MFSTIITGTTINIVFRPENQPFFNGKPIERLRDYGIYNYGSFNKSNKYLFPCEWITFGEISLRSSGVKIRREPIQSRYQITIY